MKKIIYILAAPLILVSAIFVFINTFSGIVSFFWLVILGQWKAIGIGLGALILSQFTIPLALGFGLILAMPAVFLLNKKQAISSFFGCLMMLPVAVWNYGVMCGYSFLVLRFFYFFGDEGIRTPLLIWSYGIVSTPWALMASKEENNDAKIQAVIISASYLATIAAIIFLKYDFANAVKVLLVGMALGIPIQGLALFFNKSIKT